MQLTDLHESKWAHPLQNIRRGELITIVKCRYPELVGKTAKVIALRDDSTPEGLERQLLLKVRGKAGPLSVEETHVVRSDI